MGFVIASDEQNRTALLWIQISSGRIKRLFHISESAKISNVTFIDNTTVVVILNQTSYFWNYEMNEPKATPLVGFVGLDQQWDGHEDVTITQTWDDPTIPPSVPVPPYPPEYTDVMSPDAFPLSITRDGTAAIVYDCCSASAPKFSLTPTRFN